MTKTILSTGVEITYHKNGNIKELKSPYDSQREYGRKCVKDLRNLFKNFYND